MVKTAIQTLASKNNLLTINQIKEFFQADPFNFIIKEDNGLYTFKYNQIRTKFNHENALYRQACIEARGMIFTFTNKLNLVCYAFDKFFNHDESVASAIDWSTAKVQEKLDGSLIKIFCMKRDPHLERCGWLVASNGKSNAFSAFIDKEKTISYGDVFIKAVDLEWEKLNPNFVYIFELINPEYPVIIKYDKLKVYHIGTRDMTTLQEIDVDIGVEKPKLYKFSTFEECIYVGKNLPPSEEGYVVVDDKYRRNKIKGFAYIEKQILARKKISMQSLALVVIKNEQEEFLADRSDKNELIPKINKISQLIDEIEFNIREMVKIKKSRKEFAMAYSNHKYFNFAIHVYNGKSLDEMRQNPKFIKNFQKLVETL